MLLSQQRLLISKSSNKRTKTQRVYDVLTNFSQRCVFDPCDAIVSWVCRVNDVIADKNVVTKIMNNSTGLQRIGLNGFAKRHLANWLLPLCIWLVFRPVPRPRIVPIV